VKTDDVESVERAESATETFLEEARLYWRSQGSALTQVRRVLCEVIVTFSQAFDAEELLAEARKIDRLISLSTVYRTLAGLTEAGLLQEVDGGDGKKNYHMAVGSEGASSHLHCTDCGGVFPVSNPCLGLRERAAAQQAGFTPTSLSLRYEATCNQLRTTGKCEHCTDAED